jgi:hypothetical protein
LHVEQFTNFLIWGFFLSKLEGESGTWLTPVHLKRILKAAAKSDRRPRHDYLPS